jgi:hypothetical protein
MSDIADDADKEIDAVIRAARLNAAKPMPKGEPGECELCGEYSLRLVFNVCAPCRDKYHLK